MICSKCKNSEDEQIPRQADLRLSSNSNPIRRSLLGRMRMVALICRHDYTSYAPYGFYLPLSSSFDIILTKELIHSENLKATGKDS